MGFGTLYNGADHSEGEKKMRKDSGRWREWQSGVMVGGRRVLMGNLPPY